MSETRRENINGHGLLSGDFLFFLGVKNGFWGVSFFFEICGQLKMSSFFKKIKKMSGVTNLGGGTQFGMFFYSLEFQEQHEFCFSKAVLMVSTILGFLLWRCP